MADLVWFILVPGEGGLLFGLMMDRVIVVPLQTVADFPLKGRPATNGALLGVFINACIMTVAWLHGGGL